MTKDALFSIDDLDAEKACETSFWFEFINSDGSNSGIEFEVLGGESETVKTATNKLIDERRRKEAVAAANVRPGKPAPITHAEDDLAFGKRLAAVRLVGWRGLKEPFSPELALRLVQKNDEISAQVLTNSDKIANFMKPLSATS